MFEPGQEGFHHVGCLVHNFETEFARMQSLSFECAARLYAGGFDAAYFDTRDMSGCFTEIHGDPPSIVSAFAQ
jgi:hypothetical protein